MRLPVGRDNSRLRITDSYKLAVFRLPQIRISKFEIVVHMVVFA
jgi:hypothetical protein